MTPDAAPVVMLGSPSHQFDLQRYARFLVGCTTSPAYTPDRVMAAIEKTQKLGWLDALVYRYVIVPGTRAVRTSPSAASSWAD